MADIAHFVDYQRANLKGAARSGVIVVGGSYSATMAAWFRQKYPDKANGAWASSAPLHAQIDFPEYKEVMSEAIEVLGGVTCSDRIRSGFAELEARIARGEVASITTQFNLCQDIKPTDQLDVWQFFNIVTDEFAGLVQYHTAGDIVRSCNLITDEAFSDPVEAVGAWIKSQLSDSCLEASYEKYVEQYSNPATTTNAMRSWLYQTCNEFGWYQTSTSTKQLFGTHFPLDLHVQLCADLYNNQ